MNIEAEVEIWCSVCQKEIRDEDDIVCKKCLGDISAALKKEYEDLIAYLKPLFQEVTPRSTVTIFSDLALEIKNKLRIIEIIESKK